MAEKDRTDEIFRVEEVTEALATAASRLLPQLSPRLGDIGREALQRVASGPSTALFAARQYDRITGMLALAWYDVPSGRKAWIEDVVVDAAARGRGTGRALVRAAVAHAALVGAEKVLLTSSPSRTAARALYRKEGFQEAETAVFALKTKNEE